MRVLILTQYYPPEIGAPQIRLQALVRQLVSRGDAVEVVTAMPNHGATAISSQYRGKWYVREDRDGATVHRTWLVAATGTGIKRMLSYASFTITSLFGLLRCSAPDIVFVESPPLFLSVPGWLAARRFGSKLVFNVADLWPDSVRELGVLSGGPLLHAAEHLESWSYRRADIVNAATHGIAQTLTEKKHVPQAKVRLLPNGVDTELLRPQAPDPAVRAMLQAGEVPVFVYAGTHGIAQGLEHVVDAAMHVEGKAIVAFIGSGGAKTALITYARARGVKNVRFIDPVPLANMASYFSVATAAIVPLVRSAVTEGARPSKIFAAFACGVPVIYSGVGEGAELIRHAGAGLVVEPENARAMADAMGVLLARPELRDMLAQRAREVAVTQFSWPPIIEAWLDSLEAVPA